MNTNVKQYCILGVELVEGLPVASLDRYHGVNFRGTVVGFKKNERSTSVLVDTGEAKPRSVVTSRVVTDAKAVLGGNL